MIKNNSHIKMPVLQVLPHLNSGGLVSGAIEVATALKKNNLDSVVFSSGGFRENEILKSGTILERGPAASKNIFTILSNKKKIIKLVNKYNIKIIHARSRAPAWSSYLAAKELNIPFVTTFHGTYGLENFLKKKYNNIMLKADAIIAISQFIKKHISDNYGVKDKIHVIPRGVNTNIFSPTSVTTARIVAMAKKSKTLDDEKVILMPARLTEWKGHKLAITALKSIKNKKVKLLIVGDVQNRNKYKNELINLAKNLKVQSKLVFLDHLRDMPALYMISDVVLSCSTKPEAFGRTVLEAQAMGRPVVAFNHGGSVELIQDNENGILTEVGNTNELSISLDRVLDLTYNKRNIISKLSIRNVKKKYLTDMMTNKTLNVYKELIKKK
ncbi:MAG: hypothetical protein CMP40_02305 [Rickettsiales bacterium]|nr:hypothetical protein [Rickettsiales bacterium]